MKTFSKIFVSLTLSLFLGSVVFAQELGNVKGKVRDEEGDKIASVQVTARLDGTDMKSVMTDKDGNFIIEGLKPGKYNLVFDKKGYSLGILHNVQIIGKKTNKLRDRLYLSVDDGTLVLVQGSVFNQFGKSIYGAKVKIEQISGENEKPRELYSGYTSRSGEFILRLPEEGSKKLRVTASAKDVAATKEVEVSEAAVYRLALTLELPVKETD